MKLNVRLTKKTKLILLGIFVFVLAGTGSYLLWRVNQPENVAPTDSQAGESYNGSCWSCCTKEQVADGYCSLAEANATGWCSTTVTCGDGVKITVPSNDAAKYCPLCYHAAPSTDEPVGGVECNVGSQCTNKCYWPEVAYCNGDGTCSCKSGSTNGCTDTEPTCTPVCDGTSSTAECSAKCAGCNNLYYVSKNCPVNTCDSGAWITKPSGSYAHCTNIDYSAKATDSDGIDETSVSVKLNSASRTNVKKSTSGTSTTISETLSTPTDCLAPGSYTLDMDWKDSKGATSTSCALSTTFTVQAEVITNTCDSGAWVNKPTGSYPYCGDISYSAKATDSDGIDESSISVRLNDQSRLNFSKATNGTSTTISETLSDTTNCLAPGSYTLAMDWKDALGAASTNCALNTSFIVQPQVLNPDWSLVKGAVEKCVDESTANPSSQLTYTVTLKNKGAGEGQITKIVDTLDSKVLASYLSNISNSGVYAGGNITWTLSDTDKVFAAGQEKIFTYVVTVPKDTFGTYGNTVTAYPATGENIVTNAEIAADCMVEVPGTGLLDSTVAKIALGVVLILFGFNFSRVTDLTRKLSISINDANSERRKKNFEKRVVKR